MAATAAEVVSAISADACLDAAFKGGKMLGILIHSQGWEVAYSGKRITSVSGVSIHGELKGFVPPVYDVTVGAFREKELEISALNQAVSEALAQGREEDAAALKLQRAIESVRLQKWTFSQYVVHNALGESRSILGIFAERGVLPPASAGDCAAPKLLEYAYGQGLEPLEIGEFWYGTSPSGPVRASGRFYPSCSWKCGPVLGYMLQGLTLAPVSTQTMAPRIIHEDGSIVVVDKPSGMPAVSGLDGRLSVEEWLTGRQNAGEGIFQVHRLDQDTSGVIVFAKSRQAQAALRRQFEERSVEKTYLAVLCCTKDIELPPEGMVSLPLAPDYEDKPRQKADLTQGKEAVTDYRLAVGPEAEGIFRFFGVRRNGYAAVEFHPRTGRSHQIRVHAAHVKGLGSPVLGDTLYGGDVHDRLCLHASSLSFIHPETNLPVKFHSAPQETVLK